MAPRQYVLTAGMALLASMLLACSLGAGCPCGSEPTDPLSEHDLSFAGSHNVENECVCRCGDDAPFALPRDRNCQAYEEPCTDQGDTSRNLVCE